MEIKFKACEFLDFSDNYSAKKEAIHQKDGTKICWHRPAIDSTYPSLVQFCKKRGRLNSPEQCLSKPNAGCSDYNEVERTVEFIPDTA